MIIWRQSKTAQYQIWSFKFLIQVLDPLLIFHLKGSDPSRQSMSASHRISNENHTCTTLHRSRGNHWVTGASHCSGVQICLLSQLFGYVVFMITWKCLFKHLQATFAAVPNVFSWCFLFSQPSHKWRPVSGARFGSLRPPFRLPNDSKKTSDG